MEKLAVSWGVKKLSKDRQEKNLKKSKRVESDRDQALTYPGAAQMENEHPKNK